MKTLHQVFNETKEHLLKQNAQAMCNSTACAYLTEDGLQCALGVHITPAVYYLGIENKSVFSIKVTKALQLSGLPVHRQAIRLYSDLQDIHDDLEPAEWPEALERVYQKHLA